MKEAYVSFKVARLLKEKEFDWEVFHFYDEEGHLKYREGDCYSLYNWNYPTKDEYGSHYCSAPTQQMACRWLREEHKIDISVTPDDGSWWIKVTELESWSAVFNGKVLNSDDIKYAYEGDTSTKEGCYEAGLWYVLKNLI